MTRLLRDSEPKSQSCSEGKSFVLNDISLQVLITFNAGSWFIDQISNDDLCIETLILFDCSPHELVSHKNYSPTILSIFELVDLVGRQGLEMLVETKWYMFRSCLVTNYLQTALLSPSLLPFTPSSLFFVFSPFRLFTFRLLFFCPRFLSSLRYLSLSIVLRVFSHISLTTIPLFLR